MAIPNEFINRAGRPKGAVGKYTALKKEMYDNGPKIVSKVVEMALSGDIQAIKLCLERLIPKLKDDGENDQAAEQVAAVLATSNAIMKDLSEKYKREY